MFEFLKFKLKQTSLKKGSFTVSPTFQPGSQDAYINRVSYDPIQSKLNRESDRQNLSIEEQIFKLSWEDQTVSHGVWSTVRGASQSWWLSLTDSKGRHIKNEHKRKEKLMSFVKENSRGSDKFDFHISLEGVRQQMLRSVKLYGVIAAEAVLDRARNPAYIKVVNPNSIKFKEPKPGKYVPYQEITTGFSKTDVSLDYPNFFWTRIDPGTDTPYARSPMEPVANTIYFQKDFLDDLQEVVKKTAWPRISVNLLEDILVKTFPKDVQLDPKKYQTAVKAIRTDIAKTLQNLEPGQAFISGNYVELEILESAGQAKGTLNPAPLLDVVERHTAQAMKTFSSVLGVTGTVDPLQQFMENQSLKGYQSVVEDCMSDIFTFFFRAMGADVLAEFKHKPQELRPESELEPARSQKFATNKQLLLMGGMTAEEFSLSMTGTPLPNDSPLGDLYGDIDLFKKMNGAGDAAPDPSDTDDAGKSPAKPTDEDDGRSDPEASSKRGKTPAAKKTGVIKKTPAGTSRKPRKK